MLGDILNNTCSQSTQPAPTQHPLTPCSPCRAPADPYGFDRRGRFRGDDGDEGRRGDRDHHDEDSEADGGYGQPEEPAERDDEYYYDMMPPQYAVADDCTCRPGWVPARLCSPLSALL